MIDRLPVLPPPAQPTHPGPMTPLGLLLPYCRLRPACQVCPPPSPARKRWFPTRTSSTVFDCKAWAYALADGSILVATVTGAPLLPYDTTSAFARSATTVTLTVLRSTSPAALAASSSTTAVPLPLAAPAAETVTRVALASLKRSAG